MFTPRPITYGLRDEHPLSSGAVGSLQVLGCHLVPILKGTRHGDHTLGSYQNHTQFGPQIAPSEIFRSGV